MRSQHAMSTLAVLALFAGARPLRATGSELMEYNITWSGVSVGTMAVRSQTGENGSVVRTIRVWNRPWIARIYPVDNTVACRIEATAQGPRHTVAKKLGENGFTQDDTLVLWPESGRAVWSNAVAETVHAFEVPVGSRDYVSFFFDLRDAAGVQPDEPARGYRLVMDRDLHDLDLHTAAPEAIRTPHGRILAIPVRAVSKSPTLFKRNNPRSVWVTTERPAVVRADVETRFGSVRCHLVRWEINGSSMPW